MEKLIDMHVHSYYSDGEYKPNELVKIALAKNICTMALTDHDTIDGVRRLDRSNLKGITVYNGIEFGAKVSFGKMHILAYDYDINNKNFNNMMQVLKDNRINSLLSTYIQMKIDTGINFTYEEIVNIVNAKHNIGKPDLALVLMKNNYVKSVREAFNKYLNPAYDKIRKYNRGVYPEEILNLIKEANGISVLAHPNSLKLNNLELEEKIKELISMGLQGIEVYHPDLIEEERKFYLYLANKYNLLISGGSDYHGPKIKPDIELGHGTNNNIHITELSLVKELERRHK